MLFLQQHYAKVKMLFNKEKGISHEKEPKKFNVYIIYYTLIRLLRIKLKFRMNQNIVITDLWIMIHFITL